MDTGLLCYLIGIERVDQVTRDPLVGSLFENLVVLEALKIRYNQGLVPNLYFYRDSNGNEVDILATSGSQLVGIEIKSSSTYHRSFKKGLNHFSENASPLVGKYLVYAGQEQDFSDGVKALPFDRVEAVFA